jgi:hypothetical protein
MITSTPRRAMFVVAAIAALSIQAAAQTDAAFASALGKIPSGLATMAQLKTRSQIPVAAQVEGPRIRAGVWQNVFKTALRYGKREAIPNSPAVTFYYEEAITTPSGSRVIQSLYFLVEPIENGQGRAVAAQFTRAEIIYNKETKQSRIEVVVVDTDGTGQMKNGFYRTDTFASADSVTEGTPVAIDLGDLNTMGGFRRMVDWWDRN